MTPSRCRGSIPIAMLVLPLLAGAGGTAAAELRSTRSAPGSAPTTLAAASPMATDPAALTAPMPGIVLTAPPLTAGSPAGASPGAPQPLGLGTPLAGVTAAAAAGAASVVTLAQSVLPASTATPGAAISHLPGMLPGQGLAPLPGMATSIVVHQAGMPLALDAGAGRVIQLPRPASTVFAADPRVAEVRPASPTSLFVFGVAPGRTSIAALDATGIPIAQFEANVRPIVLGAGEAQGAIRRLMPGRAIRVERAGQSLVLRGEVPNPAEAEQAAAIARGFVADGQTVENRLTVLSQVQVNLRVRIAEVSREVTRQLGLDWQAFGTSGNFALAFFTRNVLADILTQGSRLGVGFTDGRVDINGIIDALAQDRLITLLAEPNLTTMSGETASFLVGGEFPIPVALRDNAVTIQFKQYGVSLAFVPTVLSPGRVNMRVRPEVSELSEEGAVRLTAGNGSIQVPALSVRRAETSVELGSGQSFAIAGLLQDKSRNLGRALPWIGEIPVLGALFRSDRFQRNETELVIIVTPYVVRPTADPTALRAPTDGWTPPGDIDRIFLFRQIARQRGLPPTLPGAAGFTLN